MDKIKLLFSTVILLFCVNGYATDLKVGQMAPDFNLQATTGKFYKLSDFRGKQAVVVAWYPMANTRGCTIECKSLVEKGHLIREYDVSYMMASVDKIDKNKEFAKETKADFPMLSDPSKATAEAYDVLNLFGVASRVTFYIGKDGRILKIDEDVEPKRAAENIARSLGELNVAKKAS